MLYAHVVQEQPLRHTRPGLPNAGRCIGNGVQAGQRVAAPSEDRPRSVLQMSTRAVPLTSVILVRKETWLVSLTLLGVVCA